MTVDYLDAWRTWFSGGELDTQATMWFMSILWWGRLGKIVSFFGGATVILDLIGLERLREFGRRVNMTRHRDAMVGKIALIIMVLLAITSFLMPSSNLDISTQMPPCL